MPIPAVHQFAYGPINLILAFVLSLIGVAFGLACAVRARRSIMIRNRLRLLLIGAAAIGGVGIWLMQFIAMQGFDVPSMEIRYSIGLIALSLLLSVAVLVAALVFVGLNQPSPWRVLVAGPLAGGGIAGVNYLGMAAMRLDGTIGYQPRLVAFSILIAVVAGVSVLWFSVMVKSAISIAAGAVIFATAVCAVHYIGMLALQIRPSATPSAPAGVALNDLITPIVALSLLGLLSMLFVGLTVMNDDDVLEDGAVGYAHEDDGMPVAGRRPQQHAKENLSVRINRTSTR
jgi:NO-binding membrane sensor protein with MHYT domain